MNVEDFKVGDILECSISGVIYLCEIVVVQKSEHYPIFALIPKTASYGTTHNTLREACWYWGYTYPNLEIDKCKVLQHNFFPLRLNEIVRKTDQIW